MNDEVENLIKGTWQTVLNKKNINPESNFFDVGGDSLSLPKLLFALEKVLNRKFELMDLVEYPSIRKFAIFVNTIT